MTSTDFAKLAFINVI